MINTKELEKRWYKYKAKTFTLFLSVVMVIILLPYLFYYIYSHFNTTKESDISRKSDFNQTAKVVAKPKEQSGINNSNSLKKEKLLLSPTIPVIDIDNENRKREYPVKKISKSTKKLIKAKKSATLSAQELAIINGKDLKKEKKKINFQHSNANYIEVMLQKFKQNKNPREALLLAKAYYQKKDYIESEKWSLIANNLNKNLEESWLIFAKSKAKLGKRREALKILSSYYKTTQSSQAKALIEKIKSRSI
jgi:hypothetical protein